MAIAGGCLLALEMQRPSKIKCFLCCCLLCLVVCVHMCQWCGQGLASGGLLGEWIRTPCLPGGFCFSPKKSWVWGTVSFCLILRAAEMQGQGGREVPLGVPPDALLSRRRRPLLPC